MSGRERKGSRVLVWATYIDSSVPRSRGRRLNLNECVWKPKLEELVKAAEELGLNPIILEKRYPRNWLDDRRALEVDKVGSKRSVLRAIAAKVRELRAGSRHTR